MIQTSGGCYMGTMTPQKTGLLGTKVHLINTKKFLNGNGKAILWCWSAGKKSLNTGG
jgi:hypothetical protein